MLVKLTSTELKLILNALDTKILVIEDYEERDPADAVPYRDLYRKLSFIINQEEVN